MIKLKVETRHPLWRSPRHHSSLKVSHEHVHWIELFYDLIQVVAIFVLGNFISDNLSIDGFVVFSGLFCAIWIAWLDASWFNSLYISTDIVHRLYMTGLIVTVMICSSAISSIEESWEFFALAYAVNRFIIAGLYWRCRNYQSTSEQLPRKMAVNYSFAGVAIIASTIIPEPFNYYAFVLIVICSIVVFVWPRFSSDILKENYPRLDHLSERFALLMLIVAGEGFFKLAVTLGDKGIYKASPDVLANNVFGVLSIFMICWLYYDFAANAKPKDRSRRTLYTWALSHMLAMLGVTMIGIALVGEVKVGFLDPYPSKYAALGCFGLALYLLVLRTIQNVIEEREAHRFSLGGLRWFGVGLAIATFFIVPYVPSIVGNLLWGTALFSQSFVTLWRARKALSLEGDL